MKTVFAEPRVRLGVVNFLNTAPLIQGVVAAGIEIVPRVPSDLIGCLERGEVDIALASSIDYQLSVMDLRILSAGVLSSDGESLTVRLCSRRPLEEATSILCDSDSHTSIALLQIVMKHKFGTSPSINVSNVRHLGEVGSHWPDTVLVIGDKVVAQAIETQYTHQLDLGQAWLDQTGLPFVFAIWQGRADLDSLLVKKVFMLLDRQLRCNMQRLEQVVSAQANTHGWESELALQYLTSNIQYSMKQEHIDSLTLFFELAASCGVTEKVRPLRFYSE